jgi:tetratricopeptide (TPR) repeat protein
MLSAALLVLLLPGGCDDKIRPAAAALQNNDLTTAVAVLKDERGDCTQSPWFFELTGVAARLSGNLNEAEKAFEIAVSLDPKSARLLAALGGVYVETKKTTKAIDALERSAGLDASDSRVLFTLGTLLAQRNLYARAIKYLRKIPASDADDAVYFNLGLANSHLGRFNDARQAYFRAIDKRSDHVEAYFHVGLDYASAGAARLAVPWLFRAKELTGGRPDVVYALGEQLLSLGFTKTAEEICDAALLTNASVPLLLVLAGDVEQQRKTYPSAATKYNQALRIQPLLVAALVGLAEVAVATGDEPEARKYLQSALESDPDNPPANGHLGLLEMHSNDWHSAVEHLKKCWARDRSNPSFGLALARTLRRDGRTAEALALLKELEPSQNGSVPWHFELAQLYTQMHKAQESKAHKEAIIRLETESHDAVRFENAKTYVQ